MDNPSFFMFCDPIYEKVHFDCPKKVKSALLTPHILPMTNIWYVSVHWVTLLSTENS